MRLWTVALVLTIALAGCGDKKSSAAEIEGEAPGTSIKGVVVNPTIQPIPGVLVTLLPTGTEDTTDLFGRFAFSDLDPGTYTLRAEAPDHERTEMTVTVAEGEVARPKVIVTPLAPPVARHDSNTFTATIPTSFGAADDQADPYKEALGIEQCDCRWIINVPRYTVAIVLELQWENQYSAPDPGPQPQFHWNLTSTDLEFNAGGAGPTPMVAHVTADSFGEGFDFAEAGKLTLRIDPDEIYPLSDQVFNVFITTWEVEMPPEGWAITNGDS